MRTRQFAFALGALAAGGLALRIAYVLVIGPRITLGADAVWYELQAGLIANGHGYVNPGKFFSFEGVEPTAVFPPLWPLLLAGVHKLGLTSERALQLSGAVVGGSTVVLTGLLGRRIAGNAAGLIAAGLVAASPALIAADGSLMSESLFVALMAGALLAADGAARRNSKRGWRSWRGWIVLGLLLALAALTRSDGLLVTPFVIGATAWGARDLAATARWGRTAAALGTVVVVLVPWSLYNTVRLDEVVLVSSNSATLLEGANCDATYAGDKLGLWEFDCLVETADTDRPESDWARAGRDAGIRYALDHPARLPLVGAVRVLRAWGLYDPIDQARTDEAIESRHDDWQVFAWAAGLPVLAIGVAGIVIARRRRLPVAPLLGVLVGTVFVVAVSWGNPRFRLASDPALAVFAAVAVTAVMGRTRSRPEAV